MDGGGRSRPFHHAVPYSSLARVRQLGAPGAGHVAHLGQSFEDFWSRSVSARTRSNNRAAWRSLEQAGVVISRGNSPKLVREFYQVYLQWIAWRARQRKMPTALARWRARQ